MIKTRGKAEQEGGQPFFCSALAQQHHNTGVAADLFAHQAKQLVLKVWNIGGEFFQPLKWYFAYGSSFKCFR